MAEDFIWEDMCVKRRVETWMRDNPTQCYTFVVECQSLTHWRKHWLFGWVARDKNACVGIDWQTCFAGWTHDISDFEKFIHETPPPSADVFGSPGEVQALKLKLTTRACLAFATAWSECFTFDKPQWRGYQIIAEKTVWLIV